MSTTLQDVVVSLKPKEFLDWIYNRLKFRYSEQEYVLSIMKYITDKYTLINKENKLSDEMIYKICRKYYIDFDIDKSPELNIGYTDKERAEIKKFIVSIIEDSYNI